MAHLSPSTIANLRAHTRNTLDFTLIDSLIKKARPGLEGIPNTRQITGGASRLTFLISYANGSEFILKASLDDCHFNDSLQREYTSLIYLNYDLAPTPVLFQKGGVTPSFLVMERSEGDTITETILTNYDHARALSENFVDRLVDIHEQPTAALLAAGLGNPAGYLKRQLNYWTKQFWANNPSPCPIWQDIVRWLSNNVPLRSYSASLLHNDFRLDNLLVSSNQSNKISAILDWEMTTVGDPLLDLGIALSYWIEQSDPAPWHHVRWQPSHIAGMLSRIEIAERYAEKTGRGLESIVFYYVFGIFRKSCITRNLYSRRSGHPLTSRYELSFLDNILKEMACIAIQRRTL